ncbi:hypothetical protein BKA70DRAFT_1242293 [Coprinopsis sp. MPI-PUGE-AT-0042]|nr:hypothetical protein BKA70DRAFT_1242293 [Coprinopsis sp. MPI-PUGE-AT-0042]
MTMCLCHERFFPSADGLCLEASIHRTSLSVQKVPIANVWSKQLSMCSYLFYGYICDCLSVSELDKKTPIHPPSKMRITTLLAFWLVSLSAVAATPIPAPDLVGNQLDAIGLAPKNTMVDNGRFSRSASSSTDLVDSVFESATGLKHAIGRATDTGLLDFQATSTLMVHNRSWSDIEAFQDTSGKESM